MGKDMRAALADALANYHQTCAAVDRLTAELPSLTAVGRTGDGSVTATVDHRGELIGLVIDPLAGARLEPRVLSARVLEASAKACAEIRVRGRSLVDELLPSFSSPHTATAGQFDPTALLADPAALGLGPLGPVGRSR